MGKRDIELVGTSAPYMVREIREVDEHEVPAQRGYWKALFYELMLRLERTSTKRALRLEFENMVYARRAHTSLGYWARRNGGRGTVRMRLVEEERRGVLYVRRGEFFGRETIAA